MKKLVFIVLLLSMFFHSFESDATRFNMPTDRDMSDGKAKSERNFKASKSSRFEDLIFTGSALWSSPMLFKVHGNYIFTVYANGLQIMQKSADTLSVVSRLDLEIGPTAYSEYSSLHVESNYAFVQLGSNIHLVDISDIEKPNLLSTLGLQTNSVYMTVKGSYIYVSNRYGFQIAKVSGGKLQFVKNVTTTNEWHGSIATQGNRLYLGGYGLYIFDISDPENPDTEAFIPDNWSETQVSFYYFHLENNLIIIAQTYIQIPEDPPLTGLAIFKLNSEGLPEIVFSQKFTGIGANLDIDSNRLYVNDLTCGLRTFDITTPSTPAALSVYATPGLIAQMSVENHKITYFTHNNYQPTDYCQNWINEVTRIVSTTDPDRAFFIEDLEDLQAPNLLASYKIISSVTGVDLYDNYAFTAVNGDYRVVDISNDSNPTVVSAIETPGIARRAVFRGNRLYVADDESGLSIFDLSDISKPLYITSCPVEDKALDIEVFENSAFIADASKGLKIISIDEDDLCTLIGKFECVNTCTYASDIKLLGRSDLFIAGGEWLNIVSASDPGNPTYISRVRANPHTLGVRYAEALWESGLYLFALHTLGSTIFDVSNYYSPVEVSNIPGTVQLSDVLIDDSYLYMGDISGSGSIVRFDLSDLASPILSGELTTPGLAREFAANTTHFVIADSSSLRVYRKDTVTDVHEEHSALPKSFTLFQNYPNPFNPSTNISFDLVKRAKVELIVFNTLGQKVKTLITKELSAGNHHIKWDGRNNSGKKVATGLYFYRLTADERSVTKKMMLIR